MNRQSSHFDERFSRRRGRFGAPFYLTVCSALLLAAFAAGYFWKSHSSRGVRAAPQQEAAVVTPESKRALDLIDEAIRAKYEKRASGALAALDRARKTDPSVPGIDVVFAELALNEKKLLEMRAAAESARKKNDYAAAANVLLGMDKWINRGASDREMSSAADFAGAYFAEAADLDFFAASAWFFWADVSRYAGRAPEGRERALSALHRFQPWDSSDLLAAKVVFSSAEAGETAFAGSGFLPDSAFARAASDYAVARTSSGSAVQTEIGPLAASASQLTIRALASDPLLGGFTQARSALPILPP